MVDTAQTHIPAGERLAHCDIVEWAGMAASVNGTPYSYGNLSDKTVQVFGTFNGGTVTMQGSNDKRVTTDAPNAVWFTLTDLDGTPLAFTSDSHGTIKENPRFIRPSNGVNVTSTTCVINSVGGQ